MRRKGKSVSENKEEKRRGVCVPHSTKLGFEFCPLMWRILSSSEWCMKFISSAAQRGGGESWERREGKDDVQQN